jgi:hypothetical protein
MPVIGINAGCVDLQKYFVVAWNGLFDLFKPENIGWTVVPVNDRFHPEPSFKTAATSFPKE